MAWHNFNRRLRPYLLTFIIAAALFPQGCMTCLTKANDFHEKLYEHRSPMVSVPAKVGFCTGFVCGAPLVVPGILVTAIMAELPPYNQKPPCQMSGFAYLGMVATGYLVEDAVALPCWTFFGWWWPEKKAPDTPAPLAPASDEPI